MLNLELKIEKNNNTGSVCIIVFFSLGRNQICNGSRLKESKPQVRKPLN